MVAFYRRVVGEGRIDEIPAFIDDACVDHNAPADAATGPAAVERHLRGLRNTFPDFELHVHEIVAGNDWLAVRVIAEATQLGEWLGIVPSGRRIRLKGINLDRVAGGRIVEHRDEADTVGMLLQMGLDPFASAR